jgi:hypothetical protein
MYWMVLHRPVELARVIGTRQTIGIINILVAMSRVLLSNREQMHEHSIETSPLTIMEGERVFRMDDLQKGETWKPRECCIQVDLQASRLGLI